MATRELKVSIVGDAASLNKALSSASAGAQSFGQKMQNIGGQITSVGKKLTLGVTTPLVAAGVASFKMAEDFETSMSRVVGLAGQSEKQVDQWGKKLLILGPQLGKSPRELAEALYFVASSGVSTGKALNVVTTAAKASTAGLGDTQQVADALTSVMNAYGEANMSAARAADVLVATVREGKGEAADFAPVIGNVTSFASQLGVSFEEVGAALAAMTRLGVDAATASTQLQGVFSNLVRPTQQVQKALKAIGLTQKEVVDSLQQNGLLKTLQMLREHAKGDTKALIPLFGNIRALRGVFALIGSQASVVEQVFKRMGDSTGSLALAFEESTKRTGFTMDKFKASVEASGIAIGSILAPMVEKVATFLTRMSVAFQNLDPQTQRLIIGAGALAAVLGPMLIIVGSLVGAIGSLIPVFAALASGPGLVVIALVALGVAFAAAVLWPDKLQAALQRMGVSAKTSRETVEALRNAFQDIRTVVETVWPVVQRIVVPALQVIAGVLRMVSALLRGDWSAAWRAAKETVVAEMKFVLAAVTAVPRLVLVAALAIGKAILSGIEQGLAAIPGLMHRFAAWLGIQVKSIAGMAGAAAVSIGLAILNGIGSGLAGLGDWIKNKVGAGVKWGLEHVQPWSPIEEGAKRLLGAPIVKGTIEGVGHLGVEVGSKVDKEFQKAFSIVIGSAAFQNASRVLGQNAALGIVKGFGDNQQTMAQQMTSALVQATREAIAKAGQSVKDARSNYASAFSSLAQAALSAYDAAMSAWKAPAQKILDARALKKQKDDLVAAINDANAQIASANTALAKALAGGDPAEIQSARNQQIAAQKAYDDALYNQQTFALEQRAAQQQAAHDKQAARNRIRFEADLADLQRHYGNQEMTTKQFHARLNALMDKYGVDQKFLGSAAGISLAQGITSAIGPVVAAVTKLAKAIERYLKLKKKGSYDTEEGPMSDFGHWWDRLADGLVEGINYKRIQTAGAGIASSLASGVKTVASTINWQTLLFPSGMNFGVGYSVLGDLAKSFGGESLGQTILNSIGGVTTDAVAPAVDAMASVGDSFSTASSSVETLGSAIDALPDRASQALSRLVAVVTTTLAKLPETLAPITAAFDLLADAIHGIGSAAYYARNALRDTANEIAALWALIAASGAPLPGRASGGPVMRGQAYVVGESGPEIFIPSTSGRIVANGSTSMRATGGQTVIALNFYGPAIGTDRQFQDLVRRALYDVSRRNPGTGLALA